MNSTDQPPFTPESGWPHPEFNQNQNKIPPAEWVPWFGKFVACSWDGTRILAGADTREGLDDELERLGIDWRTVVHSYVDDPEVGNW